MKIKIKNVIDNECTLLNNSGSGGGGGSINNKTNSFNTFYHPSDKQRINPYLVWPIKHQGENDYYCLNFLQIFDSPPLKIKSIIFEYKIINFKIIKNKSNEWILLKNLLIDENENNNYSFTNKTIDDYNICNNTITLITNDKIYIFKNINDENNNNIKYEMSSIETLLKNQFFSITSSPIIDLKWSNNGLILLLITNKKIFLLKWNSFNEINFNNLLFIYEKEEGEEEEEEIDDINNDFLRVEWIDNENFIITSYPSIQTTTTATTYMEPILKLPSISKPSIKLFEENTIEEVEEEEEEKEVQFIKSNNNNNNNSIIESLFMVNQSTINNKTNTLISKPLISIESESSSSSSSSNEPIETINKKSIKEKGSYLLLFKIYINSDENKNKIEIKNLDKIKLNINILTPNILTLNYENDLIGITSTFSKYIQLFKILKNGNENENSIIIENNNNKLLSIDNNNDNEFSKYKSKGLSILSDNKLYIIGGEKLNEKGIGLSFRSTSNWKISLFISTESIEPIKSNLKNNENENSSNLELSPSTSTSLLNIQNLILNKLNSIENILTNHSNRLSKIENSINLITNHLKINKN
ncbi:hypothetical protein DDB_G0275237 [Dictyostelium discoideum AX4]|uniref:Uncharacterized protein n=1 Tax=Dictyostelium discoideum TaxID=44689 RepID=Q554I9_DICDI|nr:hypothetical protein DDB_G0275237 [Dictyostelium discoideum AX4]EAL69899.2 hypothetical protein DDB_G0275237 [Dictyostelium discoideum AX4]|eukprot:XP_643722.2 hypothetical protein DDB_G0275237 [Dictyostelium discoideum AX4]